jgi:hypothetical protein
LRPRRKNPRGMDECPKCTQLWLEYVVARREHVQVVNGQDNATDVRSFRDRERKLTSAAVRRKTARAALEEHQAAEHQLAGPGRIEGLAEGAYGSPGIPAWTERAS